MGSVAVDSVRCTGRDVDRHLQPVGDECGRPLTLPGAVQLALARAAAGGVHHAVARYVAVAACAGPRLVVAQARYQPHAVPAAQRCHRRACRSRWEAYLRELARRARARGWRVAALSDGRLVLTCDRCSRPDPVTVALCRDLRGDPAPAPVDGLPVGPEDVAR